MSIPAAESSSWPQLLSSLIQGQDLAQTETQWAMSQIMSGEADPAQISAFLMGLRAKGETVDELAGLVDSMLSHAVALPLPATDQARLDVVGTGGDGAHTVNISTMAAVVAAACGVQVVKHGNRAATSSSGAADVLESLGVRLDLPAEQVATVAQRCGITFCFAQVFHPAMRFAMPVRRALGVPTTFNFLGPLTNPGHTTAGAIGCADERMAPLMAGVFAQRGSNVLVMRGEDGLDEFSISAATQIWQVREGHVTMHRIDALDLGVARSPQDALRGGDPAFNAKVFRDVMEGRSEGNLAAVRDAVALNAAAAIVSADHSACLSSAEPLAERLKAGLAVTLNTMESGAAGRLLAEWIEATNEGMSRE